MAPQSQTFKCGLCKKYRNGTCKDPDCQFAHGIEDLRVLQSPNLTEFKKEPCSYDQLGRFCPLGEASTNKQTDEASYQGYCALYHITQRCYFPSSCPYEFHPFAKPAAPFTPNRSPAWRIKALDAFPAASVNVL